MALYIGNQKVAPTVNRGGTTPTGTLSITQNGIYDVTNYASADVNVSGGGGGGYTVLNTYNIELEDTGEGSVPLYGDLFDDTEFYLVLDNNTPVAYYTVSGNYINVCDDGTNGFLTFSYMSDTASYNESSNDFFVTCTARYNSSSSYAIFNLSASF